MYRISLAISKAFLYTYNYMITPTYEYKQLTRTTVDGSRKYLTPDGSRVASVTTILDKTKPEESVKALAAWRKNVGYAKAAEITQKAAGHGTKMHSYLEGYINTDALAIPGNHPMSIQSNKMANIIVENGLKNLEIAWGTEISLYFPKLFAGTTDLAGVYKGTPAIVDFKQTNKLKTRERVEDYLLQLAAYAIAHDEVYNTKIEMGVILMCSQNLEFQTWELTGVELEEYKEKWWARVEKYYNV